MKLKSLWLAAFLFLASFAITPAEGAQYKYVGAAKCKSCHKSKKSGNQYGLWKKRKHSKAFASAGITEKQCMVCHAPALYDENGQERDKSQFGSKFKKEDGVQCEDCHGPGEKYRKIKIMRKIAKEGGAKNSPTAKKTGLLTSDAKSCGKCHAAKITVGGKDYANPTYKGFDFEARYKEILHPKP